MKITNLLKTMLALGLVPMSGTTASANLLSNGNLDAVSVGEQNGATPTGWRVIAYKALDGGFFDGCSSETWCNVADPGGYGLFFKPFQGDVSIHNVVSVEFFQDNPGVPGAKYTLSGYASAEANYSGWFTTNSPLPETLFVVHFLDQFDTVIQSNTWDLVANGLPVGGGGAMGLLTTPQYTAPAGTAKVRAGASMLNTYSTTGSQSFFVDAFDLQVEFPPGAPVITNQPANTTVRPGDTAVFTVGVSNTAGVTYQWQSNQVDVVDGGKFSGATTPTLTISNVSSNEVATYRVNVTNPTATVPSDEAALATVWLSFYPAVEITGEIGDTYRVDYATQLAPTTWIPLSTNVLTISPQLVVDPTAPTTSPGNTNRFYRAILVD
jgi:hypothetical protein